MTCVLGMRPSFLAQQRVYSRLALCAVLTSFVLCAGPLAAQTPSSSALSGKVTSPEEGAMEGVLVSAKRAGSTITTTVVSNAQGQYGFPRERMEPGRYSMTIRAVGYELAGSALVELSPTAALDLNLVK